jgi:hypothetical protein
LSAFRSPKQTIEDFSHPEITLAEARLIAEF